MKQALIAVMAIIILVSVSCTNKSNEPGLTPETKTTPHKNETIGTNESQVIQITNDLGQTIPDARLLLGDIDATGGNWLIANEKGYVTIPATWTNNQDITIEAPGYVRVTTKDQSPKPINVVLRKKSQLPSLSMKGTVSGITTKDKDGYVDFAIALDSMTKRDLLNFNINKIVSPWTEKMSVMGFEFPIPQNIFVPKQKESYILAVTLQKPWFNLFYDSYGKKSIYTIQGKFPMKKVISELQNKKPYYELVNLFDFSSSGQLSYDFLTTTTQPTLNSAQIKLDKNYSVKAPKVDTGQVALGISAFKDAGSFQPLDVKYMLSEQTVKFKSTATALPYFIGVVKNSTEFEGDTANAERMSVSIDAPSATMNYLPLMNQPTWLSSANLQIDLPVVSPNEFEDHGMVIVISEMQSITLPDGKITKYKIPIWELHTAHWSSHITVPQIDTPNSTPKRVEVTLLAKKVDTSGQQNPLTIVSTHEERVETSTHLTKSARDY